MTTNTLPDQALTLGGFLRDRRARLSPGPGAAEPAPNAGAAAGGGGHAGGRERHLVHLAGAGARRPALRRGAGAARPRARAGRCPAARCCSCWPSSDRRRSSPTPASAVAPALQRVLDAMPTSPAFVRTPTWDIVAWNAAAAAVLTDFSVLPIEERNVLRRLFGTPAVRASLPDWEANARFAIAVFRVDVARAGVSPEAARARGRTPGDQRRLPPALGRERDAQPLERAEAPSARHRRTAHARVLDLRRRRR